MATLKNLANRVRAFDRDERGAAGSIETIGAVAVGVLILASVLKMVGDEDNGLMKLVKDNIVKLIGKLT